MFRPELNQRLIEVIVNIDSFCFAQTGLARPFDLVRWRVYQSGTRVPSFAVVRVDAPLPVIDGYEQVLGHAGRTRILQVMPSPEFGVVRIPFRIVIEGVSQEDWVGQIAIDTGQKTGA